MYVDASPEKRMWQSVLLLFFRDILHDRHLLKKASNGQCKAITERLENHLTLANTDWLRQVCEFCDRDYYQFRELVTDIIEGEKVVDMPVRFNDLSQ